MKPIITLPALALLAACATPQEQCINTASNAMRTLQGRIATIEGNISRGYAIHKQQQPRNVAGICYDLESVPYACLETEFRIVETPVPVDMADQRRQLADLKRRLPAEQKKARQGIATCRATYPE
jgi:hypothetical protein